jgi:arsenate reductase
MKRILVLCTGNSCRSQMAEAYLRFFGQGKANVYSAGTAPKGLHPLAVQVMLEDGIDLSTHSSDSIEIYLGQPFDVVLTVCDHASEVCPVFPGGGLRVHHAFLDPAHAQGEPEKVLAVFREVRNQIKIYAERFLQEFLS